MIRHPKFDSDFIEKQSYSFERRIEKSIGKLGNRYTSFFYFSGTVWDFVVYNWFARKDKIGCFNFLQIAALASLAFFKVKDFKGEKAAVFHPELGEFPIQVNPDAFGDYRDLNFPSAWIFCFFLQIISRNNEGLQYLCEHTVPNLQREKSAPYLSTYVAFLRSSIIEQDKAPSLVVEAYKQTFSEISPENANSWLELVTVPEMELLIELLKKDEKGFNKRLKRALNDYGAAAKGDEFPSHSKWLMPVGFLAISVLAHENGIKINAKSDYLPEWIIEGKFPDRWRGKIILE